jgi:hypothetical protein
MYCSSCGVVVAQGLSYCNYCGAKLSGGKADDVIAPPEVKPGFLVFAMVAVFVFGLVAITMLMGMMKAILQLEAGIILGFAVLCFFIMLSLEGVFIRLLFRGQRGGKEAGDTVLSKGQATKELDAAHAPALSEPVASVTEHTTRAFAPIYTERTSK